MVTESREDNDLEFKSADYILFVASLVISSIIGFIAPCFGNNNKPIIKDFLLGGGTMHYIPVGFSMIGSVMNAVFILGGPAVVYFQGAIYSLHGIAFLLACPVAALLFVPFFRDMQENTSCYEYLEKRFNKAVRVFAAIAFTLYMLVFLGVVLYAPALAFSEVTGLPMWFSIAITALFCTKYTVVGGVKAVVWADTYQVSVAVLGLLVIAIMGGDKAGDSSKVADSVVDGGRLNFGKWSPDPREHMTVWTQIIGNFFTWLPLFGCNQMVIQRYHIVPTKRDAQKAVLITCVLSQVMILLVAVIGLVMYAYYDDCDPYRTRSIDERDQILPYFLMEIADGRAGLPGLFAAAMFSAALSTMSSAINSMACVFLEDFIKPIFDAKGRPMKDEAAVNISKLLSFIFGLAALGLSYVATYFGHNIIQVPITLWGMVGGPLMGLFFLGMFFPCCDSLGAAIGFAGSLIFTFWLAIGSISYRDPISHLSLSVECMEDQSDNSTFVPRSTESHEFDDDSSAEAFYNISSVWYGLLGMLACLLIGLTASLIHEGISRCRGHRKKRTLRRNTLVFPVSASPWFDFTDDANSSRKQSPTTESKSQDNETHIEDGIPNSSVDTDTHENNHPSSLDNNT